MRLADRAKRSKALRADFTSQDLVRLLMANAGLVHRTADEAPNAWSRFTDLTLDGLRNDAGTTAAHPSTAAAIRRAMGRRGETLGLS